MLKICEKCKNGIVNVFFCPTCKMWLCSICSSVCNKLDHYKLEG